MAIIHSSVSTSLAQRKMNYEKTALQSANEILTFSFAAPEFILTGPDVSSGFKRVQLVHSTLN